MESLVKIPQSELNSTLETLNKLGVRQEHFKKLRNSRSYARSVTNAFLGVSGEAVTYDLAFTILRCDFIPPEHIARAKMRTYSSKQLQRFADTLPSEKILYWLRDNGFMLVAGPSKPMTLMDIHWLNRELFWWEKGAWYTTEKHPFSREDKVGVEWLALRKEVIPHSLNSDMDEQMQFLSEDEYLPNVAEVVWGLVVHRRVRNYNILIDTYVRTASGGDKYPITVGNHSFRHGFLWKKKSQKLMVEDFLWIQGKREDTGITSARKLK